MSSMEGTSAAPEDGILRDWLGGGAVSATAACWTGGVPNEEFHWLFGRVWLVSFPRRIV